MQLLLLMLPLLVLPLGFFPGEAADGRRQVGGREGDVPLHGHGRRQTINKRPNVCNEIYAVASASTELYIGFGFRVWILLFRSCRGGQKEKASSEAAALPF